MHSMNLRSFLLGAVATILLLVIVAALVIWSGAYNVAASNGHSPLERVILSSTMDRSVKAHASGTPPQFTAAMLRDGGSEYKGMCAECHGGPGAKREEWANGITPSPPDLTEAAKEWSPAEIHWIVEHGIKMSAMPAFGATHDSKTIWNIAGFVKQLPTMSAKDYAAIPAEHEGGKKDGD